MANQSPSFFEGFYVHYLLHDLYGKIIPGGIILLSLRIAAKPTLSEFTAVLSNQYSVGWLFIIGLAWTVGFSLQARAKHWSKKLSDPRERYNQRIKFFRCANQFERNQFQRYALVIDATGNSGKALCASGLILVLSNISNFLAFLQNHWTAIIAFFIVGAALLIVSKQYIKKQEAYMEAVVNCVNEKSEHSSADTRQSR